jgi:hypothetical protein
MLQVYKDFERQPDLLKNLMTLFHATQPQPFLRMCSTEQV